MHNEFLRGSTDALEFKCKGAQGHRDRLRVTSPSENRHRKHTTGVALSLHLIALHFPLLHF